LGDSYEGMLVARTNYISATHSINKNSYCYPSLCDVLNELAECYIASFNI